MGSVNYGFQTGSKFIFNKDLKDLTLAETAILAVLIVLSLTWIILRFINGIYRVLGKTGSIVIARVMALLIAAIAVQYILTGVTHFTTVTHLVFLAKNFA